MCLSKILSQFKCQIFRKFYTKTFHLDYFLERMEYKSRKLIAFTIKVYAGDRVRELDTVADPSFRFFVLNKN